MSLYVGKCVVCSRLFQASEKENRGVLEVAGNRYSVQVCDSCQQPLKAEKARAYRLAHPDERRSA